MHKLEKYASFLQKTRYMAGFLYLNKIKEVENYFLFAAIVSATFGGTMS
jgi:hypothetical protein